MPLPAARRKRDELRRLVADGQDPGQLRKKAKLAASQTFKHVREEWEKTIGAKQAQATQDRRASQVGYLTKLENRPVASISAQDVLEVLRPIEKAGKETTAHQVLRLVGQLLRYAVQTGRAARDVTVDLRGALAPIPKSSYAAITDPKQLGAMLAGMWSYAGQPSTIAALTLSPLTFLRSSELRLGMWKEICWSHEHWHSALWEVRRSGTGMA